MISGLAYSTNAYTRFDLGTAIDRIAALGFDGVEILCDKPHWFFPTCRPADYEHAIARIRAAGLGVSNLNVNTADGFWTERKNPFEPSLGHPDASTRETRLSYTEQAIHLAREIKAHSVSVTSGLPLDIGRRRQTGLLIDSLQRLCEIAELDQVRIGIEYEPGLLLEYGEQVMEVIEKVGSPLLGVNFDIGHSFLNHEPVTDTIKMLGARIWNVHVEDIRGDKHFHLIPGEGDIPLRDYVEALDQQGYSGYLTVELYTYDDAPDMAGEKSLAYLRSLQPRPE